MERVSDRMYFLPRNHCNPDRQEYGTLFRTPAVLPDFTQTNHIAPANRIMTAIAGAPIL